MAEVDLPVASYILDSGLDGLIYVTLDRVDGRNGVIRWAIRDKGACLNKSGKWDYEPLPSRRSDAFFRRCRWDSAQEALAFWQKCKASSRFSHYRKTPAPARPEHPE